MAGLATGKKALRLNRERWHLAETGGSDAHFPEAAGTATTLFPGTTAEDCRRSILECTTSGILRPAPSLRSIGLRRLLHQQVRGLSVTPKKVLGPHAPKPRQPRTAATRGDSMKIALVSPYDWRTPGGVNRHIDHIANEYLRRGHETRIVAPASGPVHDPRIVVIGRPTAVPASGSMARISFDPRVGRQMRATPRAVSSSTSCTCTSL